MTQADRSLRNELSVPLSVLNDDSPHQKNEHKIKWNKQTHATQVIINIMWRLCEESWRNLREKGKHCWTSLSVVQTLLSVSVSVSCMQMTPACSKKLKYHHVFPGELFFFVSGLQAQKNPWKCSAHCTKLLLQTAQLFLQTVVRKLMTFYPYPNFMSSSALLQVFISRD